MMPNISWKKTTTDGHLSKSGIMFSETNPGRDRASLQTPLDASARVFRVISEYLAGNTTNGEHCQQLIADAQSP